MLYVITPTPWCAGFSPVCQSPIDFCVPALADCSFPGPHLLDLQDPAREGGAFEWRECKEVIKLTVDKQK